MKSEHPEAVREARRRAAADRAAARRRELFGAVCDLPRADLIAWLRVYSRRHPESHPRTREARRWLAALEDGP